MNLKTYIKSLSRPQFWFYVIILVFACVYYTMTVTNHYLFRSFTEDYGLYNFAFWDYSHFRISPAPTYKIYTDVPKTLMDDHFSFTLFYFVPIYWVLNWLTGTYTLSLIQDTFLIIGGLCLYRLIKFKSKDEWLALLAMLYYFLMQGHFSVFTGDFNIGVIASSFVLLFVYFFEIGKYKVATLMFLLALFSKENIALWFIFIMPVLMITHKKDKETVKKCLYYMAGSSVFFIVMFTLFIPFIHRNSAPYDLFNYTALGPDPWHALLFVLKHPIDTFKLLYGMPASSPDAHFAVLKKEFYKVYFISGAFILFYRPQYFLWFFPIIAEKMLNDNVVRWSIETHYGIEVASLLPVAVFFTIGVWQNKTIRYVAAGVICLLAGGVTVYKMNAQHRALEWSNTTKENITVKEFFHSPYDVSEINRQLKTIPADARVSASEHILPHLSQRKYIYQFPDVEDAEYIAVFTFHDFYNVSDSAYFEAVNKYLTSPDWDMVGASYKFMLLKKQPNHLNTANMFMIDADKISFDSVLSNVFSPDLNMMLDNYPKIYFMKTPNQNHHIEKFSADMEKPSAGGDSVIFNNGEAVERGGTLTTEKAHTGVHSIKLSFGHPFGLTYHFRNIHAGDIVRLSVWRYSSKGDGRLVLTFGDDATIYSSQLVQKDENGWERLSISAVVPDHFSKAAFYIWDNGYKPVYFDDLQVERYSR